MDLKARVRVLARLDGVDAAAWDALAGTNPFVRHAFLDALEHTGCVGTGTGWRPAHLCLEHGGALLAAMPLYEKDHSYGEYVFDWSWADAYHRAGLSYYPKLLGAVPFTPVTGPRLLGHDATARAAVLAAAVDLARARDCSSLHVLLPPAADAGLLEAGGLLLRASVQFHWDNPGYADFDDFLARLSHDKRKKIRQERRRVQEAGITFRHLDGHEASEDDWRFFARCYASTYRNHGSSPYLNLAFFLELARRMPDNVLLVLGEQAGTPVCAALNLHAGDTLYGRYWGSTGFHNGLHFETCYYQAMAFCIARGIRRFEGGAQGEHKLARGFLPQRLLSAHWLADPRFHAAVGQFLRREAAGVAGYVDELQEHAPFRQAPLDPAS